METVKNAVNYVSETVQQGVSATSKEANKEVAKDSNATLSTRYDISCHKQIPEDNAGDQRATSANNRHSATAAKDALGDKIDEQGHSVNADVHKEAAKH
jgi:hypothetical protein